MLTTKQRELLIFIHQRIKDTGVSPSFDEMKEALDLASKSGIHRLITALEERGFLRRLAHRARALEVLKLPESAAPAAPPRGRGSFKPALVSSRDPAAATVHGMIPVIGRIAAGLPITAIQNDLDQIGAPVDLPSGAEYFALEVDGESMREAGILSGDYAICVRTEKAENGDIVVALVDGEEATLKRMRRRGGSIALEPANAAFETKIYGPDRVQVQGRLVALYRRYA